MKTGNRSNALLVELIIVVMFFMLAATVLMQVFAKAHELSGQARRIASAVTEAQSLADVLSVSDDAEEALRGMGFTRNGDVWVLSGREYTSEVTVDAGEDGLVRQVLTIWDADGSTLLTLPCPHLMEVRP